MPRTCVCLNDLRHRVTIQSVTEVQDDNAGLVETWADVATVKAAVDPVGASERWRLQQISPTASHKVAIRYRDDVTARNRLVFKGRVLQVRGVVNVNEDDRFLELMCEELPS